MNLKEQMAADIDIFTNPDEFGDTVTYSQGGVDKPINVLFTMVPDESSDFESMLTFMTIKYSDAPDLDKTASLILGSKTYAVVSMPKDYGETPSSDVLVNEV